MSVPSVAVEDIDVDAVAGDHTEPVVARRRSWDWLGLLPFLAFLGLFLVWPTVTIFTQAFEGESGASTSASGPARTRSLANQRSLATARSTSNEPSARGRTSRTG